MNDNENLVLESTENVEDTATEEIVEEQPIKTFTQDEVNEIVGKRLARTEAKIRKEYDKKYGELENVLKAGTGKEDVSEISDTFRKFYENKGVQIPREPSYSDKDIEVLAQAEANDIINAGFDDVVEEVDRLADIGLENMSARERAVFKSLAKYRQKVEAGRELSKIGVAEDVYESKEFKEFASKFSPTTPVTEIYGIYSKMQPKKDIQTMGSIKQTPQTDTDVKDFYSYEESLKFTREDYDKNPALFKAVKNSMTKWK